MGIAILTWLIIREPRLKKVFKPSPKGGLAEPLLSDEIISRAGSNVTPPASQTGSLVFPGEND